MEGFAVSYWAALGAGVLSFVSPCVLPLVPAYICFVGGASLDELLSDEPESKVIVRHIFVASLAFVLGFSTVFVALGMTATAIGGLIGQYKDVLAKTAGLVVMFFGLHFMGLFRVGFLNFEKRYHVAERPAGPVGSFCLGLAFAFGWTPCVGPILATILMIASAGESPMDGGLLLGAYAAGIGIPFLIAASAVKPFMILMKRFRQHMRTIELGIGGLLVVTGALIFFGGMEDIGLWLLETFPSLGKIG
ncbi:MAG: cytochrome c biogenesis protein CcdA [Magnetospirillum sp. WYHS-4]